MQKCSERHIVIKWHRFSAQVARFLWQSQHHKRSRHIPNSVHLLTAAAGAQLVTAITWQNEAALWLMAAGLVCHVTGEWPSANNHIPGGSLKKPQKNRVGAFINGDSITVCGMGNRFYPKWSCLPSSPADKRSLRRVWMASAKCYDCISQKGSFHSAHHLFPLWPFLCHSGTNAGELGGWRDDSRVTGSSIFSW